MHPPVDPGTATGRVVLAIAAVILLLEIALLQVANWRQMEWSQRVLWGGLVLSLGVGAAAEFRDSFGYRRWSLIDTSLVVLVVVLTAAVLLDRLPSRRNSD